MIELAVGAILIGSAAILGRRPDRGEVGGPQLGDPIAPSISDDDFVNKATDRVWHFNADASKPYSYSLEMFALKDRAAGCAATRLSFHQAVDSLKHAREGMRDPRIGKIRRRFGCTNWGSQHHWQCFDLGRATEQLDQGIRFLNQARGNYNKVCPKPSLKSVPLSGLMPIRGEPGRFLR